MAWSLRRWWMLAVSGGCSLTLFPGVGELTSTASATSELTSVASVSLAANESASAKATTVASVSATKEVASTIARSPWHPAWETRVVLTGASTPPSGGCGTTVRSVEPPGGSYDNVSPASKAGGPPVGDMMRVNLFGANSELPEDVRARALSAVDLRALKAEPLRGKPEDLARLKQLFAKPPTDRPIRIGVWGASHVAGEYLTGSLRRLLQERFGDAGHGFVMPAAPWTGYRATDVSVCTAGTWASDYDRRAGGRNDGRLGPGGILVESSSSESSGWIQTTRESAYGREVNRFEVLYLRQPGGGSLQIRIDDREPIVAKTASDAPGPGVHVIEVPRGPHRLSVQPVGDGPVRIVGANMELDGPGVVVDAMGINGRQASSWTRWDLGEMEQWQRRRPWDIVVLAYGTNEGNDAEFKPEKYQESLRRVLSEMRTAVGDDTQCILFGPGDRAKRVSDSTYVIWEPHVHVARIQREVGAEFGCLAWDVQAAMGGPGASLGWLKHDPSLMGGDLIHFSATGYQELATRFVDRLLNP
jgi:hypothetical protein